MQRLCSRRGKKGVQMQTTERQGFVAAREGKDTVKEHANTAWKIHNIKNPAMHREGRWETDGYTDTVNLILNGRHI